MATISSTTQKVRGRTAGQAETYLRTLAADELAEHGIAFAYDAVMRALTGLSEAYALCATRTDFTVPVRRIPRPPERECPACKKQVGRLGLADVRYRD